MVPKHIFGFGSSFAVTAPSSQIAGRSTNAGLCASHPYVGTVERLASRSSPRRSPHRRAGAGAAAASSVMHIGDLKRAVEDVVLRPEDNRLSEMGKRSTIAALDLCQMGPAHGTTRNAGLRQISQQRIAGGAAAAAARTSSSCSGEMLASSTESTCSTVLIHHGAASTAGVSATTAGGASALSLPPTARHTPFRFGDFDERSSTRSASGGGGGDPSPLPYTSNIIETTTEVRMQQPPSEEWAGSGGARECGPSQLSSGVEGVISLSNIDFASNYFSP
ncbi:unnamed protein product, partial [Gongylonema pulchrum]|uniref:Uncharacterized protein n=1 Tax=Gongylonema pulchrum TaxID=637853 RepID=A0A183E1I3_9BILA